MLRQQTFYKDWGNKKIVTIFSGVDILHPILLILIWLSIRPDFFWAHDGYAQIDRCLGDPKDVWNDAYDELLPNRSLTKTHNLCQFVGATQSSNLESAIHIFKTCLCWVVVAWYYLTSFNIFEILSIYLINFWYVFVSWQERRERYSVTNLNLTPDVAKLV